ncbi:DUF503 domain-containing protein [Melghiribacillus thermohalophilus]|uniref:DUF503 domain-containing protein n=1 Tax=Melghiribacillus thermohalophilus TaxID=1324956 RepID=UPI003C762061
MKNKIRSDLNVAISEMDYHDLWQRTCLGIVTVSRDKIHSEKVLQKSIRLLESFPELEATATRFEWL